MRILFDKYKKVNIRDGSNLVFFIVVYFSGWDGNYYLERIFVMVIVIFFLSGGIIVDFLFVICFVYEISFL